MPAGILDDLPGAFAVGASTGAGFGAGSAGLCSAVGEQCDVIVHGRDRISGLPHSSTATPHSQDYGSAVGAPPADLPHTYLHQGQLQVLAGPLLVAANAQHAWACLHASYNRLHSPKPKYACMPYHKPQESERSRSGEPAIFMEHVLPRALMLQVGVDGPQSTPVPNRGAG